VSSDGPVEHAKTWCANGHWFTPTLDTLTTQPTPSLAPEPAVRVTAGRPMTPPLLQGQPIREWAFSELRGDSLEEVGLDDGIQVGGLLHGLQDFGPTSRDADVFPRRDVAAAPSRTR
jgi:hypothetical protein